MPPKTHTPTRRDDNPSGQLDRPTSDDRNRLTDDRAEPHNELADEAGEKVPAKGDLVEDEHGNHYLVVAVDDDAVTVAALTVHQIGRHAWKH